MTNGVLQTMDLRRSGPSALLGPSLRILTLGLLALTTACDGGSGRIVARAAGHELTVDDVVEIMARQNAAPNQLEVVRSVADFWVDYALVAASAQRDSLLMGLNLSPMLGPQFDQEIIDRYMSATVQADTAISEDELRTLWEAAPSVDSVRARHILLTFPAQATDAQRDSVMNDILRLQERVSSGASFEELARDFSQDPGSAVQGGDLGFFGPGAMVQPFEEAAYALSEGEVSDPVQTPFGLHLIQLVERKSTSLEDARVDFRNEVVGRRVAEADSIFLAGVDEEAGLEVADGAVMVARELAANPRTSLSARAAGRALVDYRGGSYDAGDLLEFIQTRPPDFTGQMITAPDDALHDLVHRLGQARVLLARAEEAGVTLTQEHRDSIGQMTRERVIQATDALGIRMIAPLEGETPHEALERTLLQVMRELTAGTRSAIPLNVITVALRQEEDWAVLDGSVATTVARIDELRGAEAAEATTAAPPAPVAVPDSSGD